VNDRLRELGQLLHAERIRVEFAITCFTETDVEERFVCAFECCFGRQTGQLGHETHEVHGRHLGDERVAFGHITDQRFDLVRVIADVVAEDLCRARGRVMEAEQRVNQRGLAGAVWSKQSDCLAAKIAAEVFENRTTTE
jgi:hypothetical protein